ncbi:DofA protein [Pyxidicoccus fallax]|uniref:DofA protein n=1 Tax=Pyxidicoccus fallax TaxID=394095 RepID=A0A848LHE0_9BACT|nr:DofA protein [Pyxidicoccus fallax]NMO17205.1 DofA protein [Pyxidicoccus fallax]NPC79189.1 DofA protein [Pyxidicoccus fallax]
MATPVYKTALIDRVFFLRWEAPPSQEETQAVLEQMKGAYAQLKPPMVLVASLSPKSSVPNTEQRRNLSTLQSDARPLFSEIHAIVEGNDLQYNLQRVIISGINLVTRTYDQTYLQVHKHADLVAPYLSKRLGVDGVKLIHEARSRGVV